MGRLIDADDAVRRSREPSLYDLTDVPDFLAECPTVDAEPVRHGHIVWKRQIRGGYKYINVKCRNCGTTEHVGIEHPIDTKIPYCSECGKRLDDLFMEYCPKCGVKMDGGTQ